MDTRAGSSPAFGTNYYQHSDEFSSECFLCFMGVPNFFKVKGLRACQENTHCKKLKVIDLEKTGTKTVGIFDNMALSSLFSPISKG